MIDVASRRYASVAILLHWTIAAAIVLQVTLAGRMEGRTPEAFAVFQLHKSVGITILILSLVRLAWRLTHPPPPLPAAMANWEKLLARATHIGFYILIIAMPLTGWLAVSTSRIELPTLLYGAVPWPDLPVVSDLAPAAKHAWHEVAEFAHGSLAKWLYVLAALHVAGALKHQLFSRDEPVLGRMAPGAVPGRWLEPRLFVILAAFVAVVVFGRLVQPPHPGMAPPAPPPVVAIAPPPVPAVDPAVASAAAPPAPPTEPRKVSRWRVGPGSTLNFATAWSGQPIQGRFDRWSAGIVFGPEALDRSSFTAVINLGSVNTGDRQRDETLPSADWFDVATHPDAVYRSKSIRHLGGDRYVAEGTLELRGVTRPLALPFTLKIDGDKAEVRGSASVDRLVFGVGQGEFEATDAIPAKVAVTIELHAFRDDR